MTRLAVLPRSPWPLPVDDIAALPPCPAQGFRIVLRYPPAGLSPNARLNRFGRARLVKVYRQECWADTRRALGDLPLKHLPFEPGGNSPIALRLDFFPPNARVRDDDNAEAAFKPGRDGMAEALRVNDARFAVRRVMHPEPRDCVIVTFGEIIG